MADNIDWGVGLFLGEQVEVPPASEMDDDTFLKHLEKRHAKECRIEGYVSRHSVPAWISTYRAFHDRLHQIEIPGQYDHYHEEEQ